MQRMCEEGLLLATTGSDGKPNVMTIGWGLIGSVWARPVFLTLVRPSRYSYSLLEQVGDFTVNVLPPELSAAAAHCGSVSGRKHNKFRESKLTSIPAHEVRSPIIQECLIHYECRTVQRVDMDPNALMQSIKAQFYKAGDFHRLYFGEIVACFADDDAAERLRSGEQSHQSSLP
jgi:flavin reductase (DIM6/NTAB) family NADH-FMN oxidoreductase RutF